MRKWGYRLACLLAATATVAVPAYGASLQDVRLWAAPDRTRVVFDLSGPVEHQLFTLEKPDRVVIDIPDSQREDSLAETLDGKGFVKRVRSGVRNGDDLRLVLDLSRETKPKSFVLKPNQEYGHRLVVDLENEVEDPQRQPVASELSYSVRNFVVAVDAGHGGEDPGAVGPRGTQEKDVVMQVARRLADMINDQPEMKAVLIRDGDYYVGLRERMEKARKAKADLFVSIHADAFRDGRARGSSVYVLSRSGASSEHARWLAERENAADLVGGVSLKDKDDNLAAFMLDLSQSASIEASLDVGGRMLSQLSSIGDVHKHDVQQAGFLVLKSPDIPSVLVETAFISNPTEERKLRSAAHQRELARAIVDGIRGYVASYRPPGTPPLAGTQKHEIQPGETLSQIASRYHVEVARLRRANDIPGDIIQVGDVLTIPSGGAQVAASGP